MPITFSDPVAMNEEVLFRAVDEDGKTHKFKVSREALDDAERHRGGKLDRIAAFKKHQAAIHSLAEKMIKARINEDPILISTRLLNK